MTWVDAPSDPPRQGLSLAQGRVSFTTEGTGPPIVALHGLPGSCFDFRWFGPSLSQKHTFIRVELPAFGETASHVGGPSRADHHAFLDAVLDELALGPVVLLGHSFGGMLAWSYAAHAPERVRGLVLLAPGGLRPHSAARNTPAPGAFARGLQSRGAGLLLRPLATAIFRSLGFSRVTIPEMVRVLECLDTWDWDAGPALARQVRAPTFLAACDDDSLVERGITDELSDALPRGLRLRFPTGGHVLQKTRREDILMALLPWLAGLGRGEPPPTLGTR